MPHSEPAARALRRRRWRQNHPARVDLGLTLRSIVRTLEAAVAALLLGAALPVAAQEQEEQPAPDELHYAFATYLGSGIYKVDTDVTVQVYRIPFEFGILKGEERRWGMRLEVPVTFGFYSFKIGDVLVTELANRMATVSVVPSLRFPVRVTPKWTLTPFADFGYATDLEEHRESWLFGGGMVAKAVYPMADYELKPGFRFLWAHRVADDLLYGEELVKLESGLDVRVPLWFSIRRQQADFGVFFKNYSYFNELEFLRPEMGPIDLTTQWEFGVTLGTRTPLRFLGFKLPPVGMSYRFGDGVSAVRIVFGDPI